MTDENKIELFLRESNAIEGVFDEESYQHALSAWEYLMTNDEITNDVIQLTHQILMRPHIIDPNELGHYRKCDVMVGTEILTSWIKVPPMIGMWINSMNFKPKKYTDLDEISKRIHVKFEKIHPFIDGNGRVGRMFMNWWRLRNGLDIMVIKRNERWSYYEWFKTDEDL